MTNYVLITPEIEDTPSAKRKIGKTFLACAVVEKLRSEHNKVLHIDEDVSNTDFVTQKISEDILKHKLIQGQTYDYIVIAGLTHDVETAFRVLRKLFYPQNTKTIKLQSLS